MIFLPEKMTFRRRGSIRDSDENDDEDDDEEVKCSGSPDNSGHEQDQKDIQHKVAGSMQPGSKRRSNGEHPHEPTSERKRAKRLRSAKHQQVDEQAPGSRRSAAQRTLRRQSTMTQLVEGRKPLLDVAEPEFRPVNRGPRVSWARKARGPVGDRQQRTLTQMIPGFGILDVKSDDEVADDDNPVSGTEAQEQDSQAYDSAVAHRLAQQGIYSAAGESGEDLIVPPTKKEEAQPTTDLDEGIGEHSTRDAHLSPQDATSSKDMTCPGHGESYQPARFIDDTTASINLSRHEARKQRRIVHRVSHLRIMSSPEKRRARVIPSSQSPAESPLSTQSSPIKMRRSPLEDCSGNSGAALESPLKQKQARFQHASTDRLPPRSLKRFQGTILDSEDEDDDCIEDLIKADRPPDPNHSNSIVAQTRAYSIRASREDSSNMAVLEPHIEQSPELGELRAPRSQSQRQLRLLDSSPYQNNDVTMVEHMPYSNDADHAMPSVETRAIHEGESMGSAESINTGTHSSTRAQRPRYPSPTVTMLDQNTFPSTPMVLKEDSSEEDHTQPTPLQLDHNPLSRPASTSEQASPDRDGAAVPNVCSLSLQHQSQGSPSSKAEQQLQHEWLSYSQYVSVRPATSSSMHVAHDTSSPTEKPTSSHHVTPLPLTLDYQPSQATTLDEVTQRTPKKMQRDLTKIGASARRRSMSSQPCITPGKPPPLFIPSSFPSPTKARIETWSSPLCGRAQEALGLSQIGANLDEFSIPLPPPLEDD